MSLVLIDYDGPLTTLTLNRPERRNALTVDLLTELCAALEEAAGDTSVRVVMLCGSGNTFTSGFDLEESRDLEASLRQAHLLVKALLLLAEAPQICIAVAQGYALAGGGALIAACDYAVTSSDAKFGYPVMKVGVVPTPGMPFLRYDLNDRDFRELVFGGELWDGVRAASTGLVNKCFDTYEEALAEARRFGDLVVAGSPMAVRITKAFGNALERLNLRAELDQSLVAFQEMRESPDSAEGLAAFAEKRAPNWA